MSHEYLNPLRPKTICRHCGDIIECNPLGRWYHPYTDDWTCWIKGESPTLAEPETEPTLRQPLSALKRQVGGKHYLKMPIQPWTLIDLFGLNFYEGTILAYLLRRKGDRVEDLKKAAHTLEHYIALLEKAGDDNRPQK